MAKVIEILDSDEDISDVEDTFVSPSGNVIQSSNAENIQHKCTLPPKSPSNARSRHRRKDLHQTMRANPDIQFETITLDDEDDETFSFKSENKPVSVQKSFKTTPKILATNPLSNDEFIESAFNEFITSYSVQSKIREIAEDRVRINFLLTSYGMPDIKFSLNTQYERLKFQFEDRLKQRKMRNWNMARQQEFKIIKRRTL